MSPGSEVARGPPRAVLGYTPDEKLRLQQLRELRRRWLKDQELSPREPVLPPRKPGLVEGFWERFLQPGGLWRKQVRWPPRVRGGGLS
ncbi:PREDICTED: NADH dehydrogenase [ubiquinone] 1 beta subcomplex subunit 6 [Gekko japonicus]|uniref:NADH dehydrogenase [ubiquinone] 1 beta subcomplex subunit 6 n=1 Tax=Gekko japonicus TaxID=146911 RepID=A0ABM1JI08_GEKJA|nr:PREDICTED: NADH dehydrogenase [ubiquinone] 1 beta subcomplex subunit 6 [Gekko japonicus]